MKSTEDLGFFTMCSKNFDVGMVEYSCSQYYVVIYMTSSHGYIWCATNLKSISSLEVEKSCALVDYRIVKYLRRH